MHYGPARIYNSNILSFPFLLKTCNTCMACFHMFPSQWYIFHIITCCLCSTDSILERLQGNFVKKTKKIITGYTKDVNSLSWYHTLSVWKRRGWKQNEVSNTVDTILRCMFCTAVFNIYIDVATLLALTAYIIIQ